MTNEFLSSDSPYDYMLSNPIASIGIIRKTGKQIIIMLYAINVLYFHADVVELYEIHIMLHTYIYIASRYKYREFTITLKEYYMNTRATLINQMKTLLNNYNMVCVWFIFEEAGQLPPSQTTMLKLSKMLGFSPILQEVATPKSLLKSLWMMEAGWLLNHLFHPCPCFYQSMLLHNCNKHINNPETIKIFYWNTAAHARFEAWRMLWCIHIFLEALRYGIRTIKIRLGTKKWERTASNYEILDSKL